MNKWSHTIRRLGRAAAFSATRGFAAAAGSAAVPAILWWLQHR